MKMCMYIKKSEFVAGIVNDADKCAQNCEAFLTSDIFFPISAFLIFFILIFLFFIVSVCLDFL